MDWKLVSFYMELGDLMCRLEGVKSKNCEYMNYMDFEIGPWWCPEMAKMSICKAHPRW